MPKPNWIKTCESCAWFDETDADIKKGICRNTPHNKAYQLKTEWCARYQNIDDVNKWCDDDEPAK